MGIAPSNTLSPNTAETSNQQDHWLCELSLVAPALPRPTPTARGRAARGDPVRAALLGGAKADAARKWRTEQPRWTEGRGPVRFALPGGTKAGTLLGGRNPQAGSGEPCKNRHFGRP